MLPPSKRTHPAHAHTYTNKQQNKTKQQNCGSLQVALIQLSDYQASGLECCWEVADSACSPPSSGVVGPGSVQLPPECASGTCNVRQGLYFPGVAPLPSSPPAVGNGVDYLSVPLTLDGPYVPSLTFDLSAPEPGKEYMAVLSNCARVEEDGQEGKINHFVADEVTFTWR